MKQEIKERVERIRNGEVPEGYKETEAGIIPDDWRIQPILRLSTNGIKNGIFNNPKKVGSGIKLINVVNLYDAPHINTNNLGLLDVSKKDGELYKVQRGDLFFTRSSLKVEGIAHCNIYLEDDPIVFECHIMKISPDEEKVIPLYLKEYCISKFARTYFMKRAKTTTMTTIGQKDIENLPVVLPTLIEQKNIVELLNTWDKAIELEEKLIEEKKKLRIAIVNDLLFGLKRFDDFIKSHKYNPTKYINIPEDWEFIKIGDITTEVSEKNGNRDDLPVLSCTKYAGLVDSLKYFKRKVFSEDTSTYKQVKKNHFVYATNHIDEGSIGCQNLYENSLVSPMYTVFKTNSKVNDHFLFNLLKTRLYIFIYQVNMSASVDRRGSLRWTEFSKIRIPLPEMAEQNKIVEFIRSVDNDIELLKLELNQLKEQKMGLMQLLLTGIVRVNNRG